MELEWKREPRVLPRGEHSISRSDIDPNALKVLYRLHTAGYRACLVGGSVRDLLLGRKPKDFDVGTNARPQEIRRLFRNSRIIGRRFRLAHVYFRGGIVEVSTFRRNPDPEEQDSAPGELLITNDNVFGSPEEDAFRRDFTINALFYDVADYSVLDYVGGVEDLEARLIRSIGDPEVRMQEDPVRMTRACELAGRLGFAIEKETQNAIQLHRRHLEKAAPARLTDELLQLLRCGHAGQAMQWMFDLGLVEILLPEVRAMVEAPQHGLGEMGRILPAIDEAIAAGTELSDTTLFASLLLPAVLLASKLEEHKGRPLHRGALVELVDGMVHPFYARLALSAHRAEQASRALLGYQRLRQRRWHGGERANFAAKPYFDDALALLEIVTVATGEDGLAVQRWHELRSRLPESERETAERSPRRRQRRRRRRRR